MDFDATNRFDSSSSITPSSPGTVMYWLWTDSITGTHRCLGSVNAYETRMIDDDMHHEYYQDTEPIATAAIATDWWHHWTFTWDASANKALYRDGVSLLSGTYTLGAPGASNISIGGSYWNAGTEQLDGQMDDVRIYDRVLSPGEISTIYAAQGGDGIVEGLLHHWPLRSAAFNSGSSSEVDVAGSLDMSATPGNPVVGSLISRMRRG